MQNKLNMYVQPIKKMVTWNINVDLAKLLEAITTHEAGQISWQLLPCIFPDAQLKQALFHLAPLSHHQKKLQRHMETLLLVSPFWTFQRRRCNQWEHRAYHGGLTEWLLSSCNMNTTIYLDWKCWNSHSIKTKVPWKGKIFLTLSLQIS